MAARGQEEKQIFIQELIDKFEGAYELDKNKVVLIPFEGVELKCTITVSKGGVAKKQELDKLVTAPNEKEISELKDFVDSISDELSF